MCDVPSIAVFCSEPIECFPGTASKFFLKLLVIIIQNIVQPFWTPLAYACQIEILDTSVCLMLTVNVETVPPLDVLRRQMPSTQIPILYTEWTVGLGY
jgi:hypothetical protein